MNVKDAIQIRKSSRKFTGEQYLHQADINLILVAGHLAPYASGGPRRDFIVIRRNVANQELQGRIAECCNNQKQVKDAAALVIVCGTAENVKLQSGFPKFVHDCDAAMTQMILQATELEIGNCWVGHFSTPALKEILKTKNRPVAVLCLGIVRKD